jgi:hypothetical protein
MDDRIYLGSHDDFSGLVICTPMTDQSAPSWLRRKRTAPFGTLPPAPVLPPLPAPLENPPAILFRAECQDQDSNMYNGTFRGVDMTARNPSVPLSWHAFNDCLLWKKIDTPFIPFTMSWDVMLQRRSYFISEGGKHVVIIAVFSKGMHNIYDAYEVNKKLKGFRREKPGKRLPTSARIPCPWGIGADEDRVLAIFDGEGANYNVPLSVPWLARSITIPDAFMTITPGSTAKAKLGYKIF